MESLQKGAQALEDGPAVAGPYRSNGVFLTESCLKRYLSANDGDAKKALAQLKKTVAWRKEYKPWRPCPKCMENPLSHNLRVVGFDKAGRVIIYTSFSQACDRWDAECNLKHLSWVLEQAVPLMESRGALKWSWISDFDGFGLSDCSPKSMILVKNLLAHYPERLHKAILLEAPWIFNGLWKVVSPLLDKRTKSKVCFTKIASLLESDALAQELSMGDQLRDWLIAEAKDNRAARREPKRFWAEHKAASKGEQGHGAVGTEAVDFRAAPSVTVAKDCVRLLYQFSISADNKIVGQQETVEGKNV